MWFHINFTVLDLPECKHIIQHAIIQSRSIVSIALMPINHVELNYLCPVKMVNVELYSNDSCR